MTLYAAAHRLPRLVAGSAALGVTAVALVGQVLPIPALAGGAAAPVLLSQVCAALVAPLTAYGCGGSALALEAAARRRLLGPDAVLMTAVLGPLWVITAAGAALGAAPEMAALIRSSLLYLGLALLVLTGRGPRAATGTALGYFLVVALLGNGTGRPAAWAIPLLPVTTATVAAAVGVALLGFVVFHRSARRRAATRATSGTA